MLRALQALVKATRRSPMLVIAVTFVFALLCWAGTWAAQSVAYLPTVLLSLGCAAIVLIIGVSVYVLVAKVERNG